MIVDDTKLGTRDKRGDWKPNKLSTSAPIFHWPLNLFKILKWLIGIPGYTIPWNFFYGALAVIMWLYFTPSLSTMKNFHYEWMGYILLRIIFYILELLGLFIYFCIY